MSYGLVFTKSYEKKAAKFLKKHPEIFKQYQKTLQLLVINPLHPALRLHKLSGKHARLSSVSINMSYRITLEFEITESHIILINIGNHDQMY